MVHHMITKRLCIENARMNCAVFFLATCVLGLVLLLVKHTMKCVV